MGMPLVTESMGCLCLGSLLPVVQVVVVGTAVGPFFVPARLCGVAHRSVWGRYAPKVLVCVVSKVFISACFGSISSFF